LNPTKDGDAEAEAFLRNLTWCEEDRHKYTSAPYRSGYRWFRSSNVIPIEQHRYRRKRTSGQDQ
jgi:hypothetical protein